MENLNSKELNNLPFALDTFKRVADLVYLEEPFLTLFQHKENGHYYLFDWVDRDEYYNRWLIYTCSSVYLSKYMQGDLSQNDLFWKGGTSCYLIDIDRNFAWHNPQTIHKEGLPKSYYPQKNIFFDEDYSRIFGEWSLRSRRKDKNTMISSLA